MSDDQIKTESPIDSPKPTRSTRRSPAKKTAPKVATPKAESTDKEVKAKAPKSTAPREPAADAQKDSPKAAPKAAPKKPATPKAATPKVADKVSAKVGSAKASKAQSPVALDLEGAPFDTASADTEAKPRRSAKKPVAAKAQASANTTDATPTAEEKKPAKARPAAKASQSRSRRPAKAADANAVADAPAADAPATPAAPASKASPKPQVTAAHAKASQEGNAAPKTHISADESPRTAMAEQGTSTDADDESALPQGEDGAATPRKSRRGRRGGRGRGRGKAKLAALQGEGQQAEQTEQTGQTDDAPLQEADDSHEWNEYVENEADIVEAKPQAGKGRSAKSTKEAKVKESKAEADAKGEAKPGRRKMFISVVPGEQVEVALVEEGAILEYYLEMMHQAKIKGNIYKGVVHNVDTNLQAAFVNYGAGKNGFLQIDEIHPEYYLAPHEVAKGKKFPPIQKVIKAGQEVLVQVVKEPTGNKGAFLTTWLSLAGRFLVLTPGQEQIGVSRKVDNDEERARLREMMNGIEPGEGLGVIVRTVSAGTSKTTLKNDLQYLKRAWKEIRRKGTSDTAPCLIYQESNLAERAVRDYLTDDVCEVWVDHEDVAESLRETVSLLFPRKKDLVRVHVDVRQTLWERFNIQRQLEQIYAREVLLPSGGRLVFDQTEALMAIDINSGKISGKANFESMALRTNLEAAEAIARHLRLRDIGGQVVIDFIEMRDKNHVRDVEKTLRNAMKIDRARHDVARMSSFGLLEIVRQRTGSSALAVTMEPCPCCNGTGIRRNMEWQSLQALRQIGRQTRVPGAGNKCVFDTTPELGMYLLNHKRDRLREMEQQLNVTIEIRIQP